MTRWRRASTRRDRDRQHPAVSPRKGRAGRAGRAKDRPAVVVDEYDDLILLRSSADASPRPDSVAELARFLSGGDDGQKVFTVVVGADGADAELWARLGAVLDSLRDRGVRTVRLALSGAGASRSGRPAMAQRIADAWGINVIAPDAGVIIVPGGSLFALGADGPDRGWRSFTPGAKPTSLGPRSPAPLWQPELARLPGRTAAGHVVEQVPAGILVRSAKAPATRAGHLCYAVPVDDDHPTVLVDAPESSDGPEVPAEDIAALLAALPDPTRATVRLAPCGPLDLLSVGQDTAEMLGAEVEVLTGLPLVVGTDAEPDVRPVLIGADAEPTWAPFVEAVACRPYDADGRAVEPRLVRWRSPMSGIRRTDPAPVPLSDRWQVCVTRAGLSVGPRGEQADIAERPVSSGQLAIEVNLRGAPADDALFTDLSRLLSEIGTGVRDFVTIHRDLTSHQPAGEDFRLLRLAIDHGVSLAEPPPAEAPPEPAMSAVQTVAVPRSRRPQEPAVAPAPRSSETRTGFAEPARATESMPAGPPANGGPPRPDAPRMNSGPAVPATGGPTAYGPGAPVTNDGPVTPSNGGPATPASGDAATPGEGAEPAPRRDPADSAPAATEGPGRPPGTPPTPRGVQPLPPRLDPIPLTPVTPRSPADPDSSGGDAERTFRPQSLTPAIPATPAEPATPATPATPAKPAEPARPAEPMEVTEPTESAAPRITTESAAATPPAAPPAPPRLAETPAAAPVKPVVSPAAAQGTRPRPPVKAVRRSTEAERAEFRTLAQPVWERHSASVNRAMTRMPALRGVQVDAARTDLVAVHIHLSGGEDELGQGDGGVPAGYTACLSSGLCRLPSYRGVVVRGGLPEGGLERFMPGSVVREAGPVSALPIGIAAGLSAAAGGYVIWSATGRRVRPLLGSTPGAASDEVVFPPGVAFRVLDVRAAGPAPVVLMTEVTGGGPVDERPGGLDDADRATLERLDEALRRQASSTGGASADAWPARCAEPLGEGAA
ncbi:hypothetical protein [Actinoallomurus iriomotensis]|uniref:Basic proline-rich protein n=1 Tax=Actinoallomurus iriomotensis TaxID=478107 RepID=A0A9W6S3L5_9ACTN|nr:hypothetical protein [Actinoallomurus iriomotensis]GLY86794.1 hypothetical protein Airi02_047230 [Actinoallomurus iriomotensis]